MDVSWTTHHTGSVSGRPVTVQTSSEGLLRVRTSQGSDDEGKVIQDGSAIIIIPPTQAGRLIDIEGDSVEEIRDQLVDEGFSNEDINEIVGHFPA